MARIIEQRDVGALDLAAEALDCDVHRRLVEIELGAAADQSEAEARQRLGHQGGIVARIVEPRHVLVGGIADHQRDAPFGGRLCHADERLPQQREQRRSRQAPALHSPVHAL